METDEEKEGETLIYTHTYDSKPEPCAYNFKCSKIFPRHGLFMCFYEWLPFDVVPL